MFRLVEDEKAHERIEICRACPELIRPTGQCKKCGCFMKVKVRLASSECPIGKWGQDEV